MNKKVLVVIMLIVGLIVVGGLYFVLTKKLIITPTENIVTETPTDTLTEIEVVDKFPGDLDRDGILDEEEERLGTSNRDFDTDGDGLSDYDEIYVWGTDPTNPDTDGDGYWDGFEILNGYDPLGPGKLN